MMKLTVFSPWDRRKIRPSASFGGVRRGLSCAHVLRHPQPGNFRDHRDRKEK
jgi:hypothetical protein